MKFLNILKFTFVKDDQPVQGRNVGSNYTVTAETIRFQLELQPNISLLQGLPQRVVHEGGGNATSMMQCDAKYTAAWVAAACSSGGRLHGMPWYAVEALRGGLLRGDCA